MLTQVTTEEKKKNFFMNRLDVKDNVNVNFKSVIQAFHSILYDVKTCRHIHMSIDC